MKIDSWQKLEDEIGVVLKEKQRVSQTFFQRFYDTKSAGNTMPNQPSDFLAIYKGSTHYIEAKFSAVNDSLRSCFASAVDANQIASARLAHRAGARYWIVFYSLPSKHFEVWPGLYCAERRAAGKPLDLSQRQLFKTVDDAILIGVLNNYTKRGIEHRGERLTLHRPPSGS
jgi:hypothetical protein